MSCTPSTSAATGSRVAGTLGMAWGTLGFLLLLVGAVARLTPLALEGLSAPLHGYHLGALLAMCVFMLYSEGYRGFQRQLAPRFAARAMHLRAHPRLRDVVLAPLFCVGYYHSTTRRMWMVRGLTAGIILLIVLVRLAPQPWRGLIDAAVVLGLAYGMVTILVFLWRALCGESFASRAELPPDCPDEGKNR